LCVLFFVLLPHETARAQSPAIADHISFRSQVAPILVKKCLGCHNSQKASGGLNMSRFAALKRGGKTAGETILEPGDPEASYLIELVRVGAKPRMPYKLPPLSADQIGVLTRWVKEGAKFDGPSADETPLASLVDVLADLPKVALKAPALDPISALAFSPDGRVLAAGVGRQVLLYDLGARKSIASLADHPGPITAVRFTPDGAALVAAGGRAGQFGSVTVWDVAKRQKRYQARAHTDAILAADVARDGKTLASAGYDRQILIRDLATGKVRSALKDHSDAVYGLAFSPDGTVLASCSADRTVKLWDWAAGKRSQTLSEATAELYAVVFAPDGSRVLAGGVDRSIRIWRLEHRSARLERSVFAHDAAIVRLAVSAAGGLLASSAEDRTARVWKLDSLTPQVSPPAQADWVQALSFSADGQRLAVGRYDGFLAVWDTKGRKTEVVLREPPGPKAKDVAKLTRNATLDPPAPRGAVRGTRVQLTLTGQGVGRATRVILPKPGLTATILPARQPDENRALIDLMIAPDARVGLHAIGVITPLGVPGFQNFAVDADPELAEKEPNDAPSRTGKSSLPLFKLPATLVGTIERPGDIDLFSFDAKAGDELVFRVTARSLGSQLRPLLTLLDAMGNSIARSSAGAASSDPVLACTIPAHGRFSLQIEDADYGGSGNHFYRIAAGQIPFVRTVFPLGVERGRTTKIAVAGANLGAVGTVSLPAAASSKPGTILSVPVSLEGGRQPYPTGMVVVSDGPQLVENEPNDSVSSAQLLTVPGGVSGRIGRDQDVDLYRFRARKGERVIAEIFGRRLGSPLDSALEILNAQGNPVPRAVLRPVDATEVAFRDHNSTGAGIRLTHWENLEVNDYILFGRELARIQALPRNPDDDCIFWSQSRLRLGMLETTPEQHPMGQRMYKVEIHPPGTDFAPSGAPVTTLTYTNDDGGPTFSKDSRVTFRVPDDGDYLLRVSDVRALGGADFGYHLVLRPPHPSFHVSLETDNPSVPRGGTALINLNLVRSDDFEGSVEVRAEDLPAGITATPAVIGAGDLTGVLALTADPSAPAFSPPTWRLVARAVTRSGPGEPDPDLRQEIDPGGPAGGWITVVPRPNLNIVARPNRVEIHPGERVSMTLKVERVPEFKGRVPIEVKNLPQGVRVLNIGLNGVLVTESQTERSVFLYAEPWAKPMIRPFYAVGEAESAGTQHSSPPIELVVTRNGEKSR
jgi:hypothetical protein